MDVELLIQHGSTVYLPVIEEGITWGTERYGSPGELKFGVVKDGIINFAEGDAVRLKVDGVEVFYGFVFTKKRSKDAVIDVTAYDQLRYFKNKHFCVYTNKTAGELVQMLANDFKLQVGTVEDTGFKIASRVEENKTLFDMVQNALDLTLQNKNAMFVLFDEFGKISLKNIGSMIVPIVIDEETGENFDYSSSIDSDTYNQVVVYNEKGITPAEKFKLAKDDKTISQWGVLQMVETLQDGENGQAKADALLSLYNKKTRTLSINKAVGDSRVRAGCMVVVKLNLGDIITNNLMLVENCKHTFSENEHWMNLTLRGGEFIA